jgi:hypothetical protein
MAGKIDSDVREVDLILRESEVMTLRRAGNTWDEISRQLGYSSPAATYRIFQKALEKHVVPKIEELRAIETNRLDGLTLALWPKAESGDIRAIEAIVKLMERRARLLGLDAPTKIQAEVINYEGGELGEHTRRIIELVRQSGVQASIMGGDSSQT